MRILLSILLGGAALTASIPPATAGVSPSRIKKTNLRPARFSKTSGRPVIGAPVKSGRTNNLVRHCFFDEGAGSATERVSLEIAADIR